MQVICARRRKDLQIDLYRRLSRDHIHNHPAWLVVPEQFTLESERDLFEALQTEVLLDIRVKSFSSLTREVLERQGGIKRPVITKVGQVMVISQIFDELKDDLQLLKAGKEDQGLLESVADILRRFKADGLTPEALRLSSDKLEEPMLSLKLEELALIYEAYEAKLKGYFLDSESRLDLLIEKLDQASWLKEINFYFDGFLSLSSKEVEVIKALDTLGVRIVFFLVIDPILLSDNGSSAVDDFEAFDASISIYGKLKKKLDSLTLFNLKESPHEQDSLGALASHWFSYRPKTIRDASGVTVIQAQDPEDASREIAMHIRKQIQLDHAQYKDFRILVTDPDLYMPFVERIFNALSIPVFLDRKPDLIQNPFVHLIFDLFDAIANDMSNEGLFQWLKSPFSSADLKSAQTLEHYVRKRRLRGKMIFDDKYYLMDEGFYRDKPKLADEVQREIGCLLQAKKALDQELRDLYQVSRSKEKVRSFAQAIVDFFSPNLLKALDLYLRTLQKKGHQALYEETNQVLDVLSDLLDQMVELMGDLPLNFNQFLSFLVEGVRTSKVGLIPPALDQVSVGTIGRTRWNQTKHLIILGMNESLFPSRKVSPEVLTEDDIVLLNSQGIEISHLKKQTAAEQKIAFINALDGTQSDLIMTWELMDDRGNTQQAAQVIRKAIKAIEISQGGKHLSTLNRPFKKTLFMPPLAYANAVTELRLNPNQPHHQGVFKYGLDTLGGHAIQKALNRDKRLRRIPVHTAAHLYLDPLKMSASRLETFRSCPYKHFVRYGLRPKETEDYDIDGREYGNLLHGSADAFSAFLRHSLHSLTDDEIDDWVRAHFNERKKEFIDDQRAQGPQNTFMLIRAQKQASAAAKAVYHQLLDGDFKLYGEEIAFGDHESLPALSLDKTHARIEGRIDRIDFYTLNGTVYYRIIDYKTSGKIMDASRIYHALDTQLLIYLASVLKSDQASRPAGIFYMPLTLKYEEGRYDQDVVPQVDRYKLDGLKASDSESLAHMGEIFAQAGHKSQSLTTDQFMALIQHVLSHLSESAVEIEEGVIEAAPILDADRSACAYCDYQNICRFEAGEGSDRYVPIMTLKWPDLAEKIEGESNAIH